MMRSAVPQVEALLDALARAARQGDFDTLARRLPDLEAAQGALSTVSDGRALARLRAKAERLGLALTASAEGLKAAMARLQDIQAARAGLSVYTRQGRQVLAPEPGAKPARF